MPCGVLTSFGEALHAPIGRVYFAGTETATVWSGERHRGQYLAEICLQVLKKYFSECIKQMKYFSRQEDKI